MLCSRYLFFALHAHKTKQTHLKIISSLKPDDGSIWFGSGAGVNRYDGKTFTDFKSKEGQK